MWAAWTSRAFLLQDSIFKSGRLFRTNLYTRKGFFPKGFYRFFASSANLFLIDLGVTKVTPFLLTDFIGLLYLLGKKPFISHLRRSATSGPFFCSTKFNLCYRGNNFFFPFRCSSAMRNHRYFFILDTKNFLPSFRINFFSSSLVS